MFAASELFKCTSATSRGLAEAEDGGVVVVVAGAGVWGVAVSVGGVWEAAAVHTN